MPTSIRSHSLRPQTLALEAEAAPARRLSAPLPTGTSSLGGGIQFAPPHALPPKPVPTSSATPSASAFAPAPASTAPSATTHEQAAAARRHAYARQGVDLEAVAANVRRAREAGVDPAKSHFFKKLGGAAVGALVTIGLIVGAVATGGALPAVGAALVGLWAAKAAADAHCARLLLANAQAEARGELPPHRLPMGSDALANITYRALTYRDEAHGRRLTQEIHRLEDELARMQGELAVMGRPGEAAMLQERADLSAAMERTRNELNDALQQRSASANRMAALDDQRQRMARVTSLVVGTGLATAAGVVYANPISIAAAAINATLSIGLFVHQERTQGMEQPELADVDGQAVQDYATIALQLRELAERAEASSDPAKGDALIKIAQLEREVDRAVTQMAERVEQGTLHHGRSVDRIGVVGQVIADGLEGVDDVAGDGVTGPLMVMGQVVATTARRQAFLDRQHERHEHIAAQQHAMSMIRV